MTRATSKRAMEARDWPDLLRRIQADESSVTPEAIEIWLRGRWSDPRPRWDQDYLDAMQAALEKRDHGQLLKMLCAGVPLIAEALLPVLAEVIRDLLHGSSTGAPKKLTVVEDQEIREAFDLAIAKEGLGFKVGVAHEWLAGIKGVDAATIKRSLRRTKPS